jgi:NADH-quinone oxidoreductase subunit L
VGDDQWSLVTVICVLLFVGAMGKSAQFPLHVWLPDSMEGPTPISALIHAATMVTAGIFMVARMSPLFELSPSGAVVRPRDRARSRRCSWASSVIVQNDIKRVVAYSTLSQLGYMTVALGASAYSAAIFHLMTHAFFKACSSWRGLGDHRDAPRAGHAQDGRAAQVHADHLDTTVLSARSRTHRACAFPAGFFSKDSIIEARRCRTSPGSGLRVLRGARRRLRDRALFLPDVFLAFHGKERFADGHGHDDHADDHKHDDHGHGHGHRTRSPWVVTLPLVLLAIPSVFIGWFAIAPMLFGDYFGPDPSSPTARRWPICQVTSTARGRWCCTV